jgi:N,N-dimethylformamidase
MKILGYPDRFSVMPGESIRFLVSCDGSSAYRANIVRLIHGDTNSAGPGFKAEVLETPVHGNYRGRLPPVHAGSAIVVPRVSVLDGGLRTGTKKTVSVLSEAEHPAIGFTRGR